MSFVHLRVQSAYSLEKGLVRIKSLVKQARALDMPAVALTDYVNIFAAVKFYRAALAAGIKPILGASVNVVHEDEPGQIFELLLLCQNNIGYDNLRTLISRAYTEGQDSGKPVLKAAWLSQHAAGLIALSGAMAGDVGQALLGGAKTLAQQRLAFWQAIFGDRYYLECQRLDTEHEAKYLAAVIALASETQTPVVVTNDVCFLEADEFSAHEARVCIIQGYTLEDPKRPRLYTPEQYLKSGQEMQDLFADLPVALSNTVAIAQRCSVMLTFGKAYLPDFPVPAGLTVDDYLAQTASEGLQQRLRQLEIPEAEHPEYQARLVHELQVINVMGFPGYFLIVADFIQWAKQQGIPVGPGRGSGAGSLVAYVLGITDLDPIAHELLFERFLNPERVSMPDFDIDFCMDKRDRVIDYVAKKYGRQCVSQIITYGTMAARAVVRDVGRILGLPYGFVDKLAKLIPFELGITLTKALEQEELLRERYQEEDEVRTLFDLALKLEGVVRNVGKHAGGVVIAPSSLTAFTALYCEPSGENLVTQFDKDDIESVGLVKFDFLGLRTLTIIDWTVQAIKARRPEMQSLDITQIPTDDAASFALLQACQTTAVFQLESRGMKDLIRRLQPDCFEEITALVALFRPGPLQSGMVDDFIDRKHGRAKVTYLHPDLEPILKTTYGVILYQEQVMQIAQQLAGYTLGGADLLRRAMGKKKPEEMAKQRAIFLEGTNSRGIDADVATRIFDLMEKFAGYGFNKSHSAAYALIAYQTAWLKAHYPAEFMAAVLSSDLDNTDKIVGLLQECKDMALTVLPPDLNRSEYQFTVSEDGAIQYGLGAIKGVGEAAVQRLISARAQAGPFKDLFELSCRVGNKALNRRTLEALIASGACDGFNVHRASLIHSIDNALKVADVEQQNSAAGMTDLFGDDNSAATASHAAYVSCPAWTDKEQLRGEKETLGFYLSGHPLDSYQQELTQFTSTRIDQLANCLDKTVTLAGLVTQVRGLQTKRGDRMAIVTFSDSQASIEMAVFPELFKSHRAYLEKDAILVVAGEVSRDDYSGGVRLSAKSLYTLAQARERYAKRMRLILSQANTQAESIVSLQQILQLHATGQLPVVIEYRHAGVKAELPLGVNWRVHPSDELVQALRRCDKQLEVIFDYAMTTEFA